MLKQLDRNLLEQLLTAIASDYCLLVPQLLSDGTRQLGPWGSADISLSGPPLQRKPTAEFFSQTEVLLQIHADGCVETPPTADRPLALFGLEQNDLAGIAFLDRFFLSAPADDVFAGKRVGALLVALTGNAGPQQSFVPLTEGGCDIELVATESGWLALGHSPCGEELLTPFPAGDRTLLSRLQQVEDRQSGVRATLQQASRLLLAERVPDDFWHEIAERCILCSGCNMVCPTCSCFCLQDRQDGAVTERSRVWDSCQLDAFMREASGHNPLGTEALRTRRRIHHKLAADVLRWGEPGCVACGRCDRACPTGIGIIAVAGEIVEKFGDADRTD